MVNPDPVALVVVGVVVVVVDVLPVELDRTLAKEVRSISAPLASATPAN
jgi:hypothetical protein